VAFEGLKGFGGAFRPLIRSLGGRVNGSGYSELHQLWGRYKHKAQGGFQGGFGHIQRDKGADRGEGVTDYFILNQGVS
jgi:hypothetical protein